MYLSFFPALHAANMLLLLYFSALLFITKHLFMWKEENRTRVAQAVDKQKNVSLLIMG